MHQFMPLSVGVPSNSVELAVEWGWRVGAAGVGWWSAFEVMFAANIFIGIMNITLQKLQILDNSVSGIIASRILGEIVLR